jgi:peptide chain release factor 1
MEAKIRQLLSRLHDLEQILGEPDVFDDQKRYKELSQEHSYLNSIKEGWIALELARKELLENSDLLKSESDVEFQEVLREEIALLDVQVPLFEAKLENLLVPPDPNDHRNTILEIRAGTGGDEAALFVGDCVRMYKLFAEKVGFKYEELGCSSSEAGGFKEYLMALSGPNVYRLMQYEAGTHRVQRVPATETQGRVHTSAVTVAVLMEPDEDEDIDLEERDLRVDTYRASGAGGQHVNTTDSAVRITHLPSGMVAYSSEEKSQHKNKAKAMRLLKAKIVDEERRRKEAEIASTRASQVGSGDRSERIRTYNFPQNRITDHRINFTRYNLDHVMEGVLGEVVEALVAHFHQMKLQDGS